MKLTLLHNESFCGPVLVAMRRCYSRILAAGFFALICFGAAVNAQEKSDRLIPLDMFNLEIASDPQISPDGQKVIYVRQFSDIMTDKRYSNLWIINFDGSNNRPLTTGNFGDSSPRWHATNLRALDGHWPDGEADESTNASQRNQFLSRRQAHSFYGVSPRSAEGSGGNARCSTRREVGRPRYRHR